MQNLSDVRNVTDNREIGLAVVYDIDMSAVFEREREVGTVRSVGDRSYTAGPDVTVGIDDTRSLVDFERLESQCVAEYGTARVVVTRHYILSVRRDRKSSRLLTDLYAGKSRLSRCCEVEHRESPGSADGVCVSGHTLVCNGYVNRKSRFMARENLPSCTVYEVDK